MKLKVRREFGIIKVLDEQGAPVATFPDDAAGGLAYGWFVAGLLHISPDSKSYGTSLYDEIMEQYVVGTLDELVG